MNRSSNPREMNEAESGLLEEFKNLSKDQNIFKYAVHLEELKDYCLLTNEVGYKILCLKDKSYSTEWARKIEVENTHIKITCHYRREINNYYTLDLRGQTGFGVDKEFRMEKCRIRTKPVLAVRNLKLK